MRANRVMTAGAVVAMTVGSVSLATAAQAAPARTGMSRALPASHASASPVPHRAHMGSYGASRFATAAKKLPAGLAGQLRKQLGITPAQFLADGQAAADAGKVIAALRADGVTVFGATMNGTALTLTVPDAADAAAAQADGAEAVIGTAEPAETVTAKAVSSPTDGTSPLLGGDLWFYFTQGSGAAVCSTGFNGYDKSTGASEFLTAGHCGDYQVTGDPAPADGMVNAAIDETPLSYDDQIQSLNRALGSVIPSLFHFGAGEDSGIVPLDDSAARPEPAVSTWGSGDTSAGTSSTASQGVENSGGTVPVLGAAAAVSGEPVCHSGERTGWQCGTVNNDGYSYAIAQVQTTTGTQTVDGFASNVCLLPGDSGGSFVSGEYAVGVASASSFTPVPGAGPGDPGYNTCSGSGQSIAYPMIAAASGEESAAQSEPDFELSVSVPAPVVTAAASNGGTGTGTISGYLPRPFATGTRVSLSQDGHPNGSTTADSNGNWSLNLTGLTLGIHSIDVIAGSGHSTATTNWTLVVHPGTFSSVKAPGITGTVRVGSRVVASPGTWSVAGPTFTYQWLANGAVIAGATGSSYTIPATLAGKKLSVHVTAYKSNYYNATRTSAASTVANGILLLKVRPALSGTPAVGKKLAVTAGTWSPAAAVKVQWYANGKPVARATGTSLPLTAALRGQAISVTVTASKAGYATATVRLTESAKVR